MILQNDSWTEHPPGCVIAFKHINIAHTYFSKYVSATRAPPDLMYSVSAVVTVWEIFTCGKVPYHGISCMALPGLLCSGEHLEKPHNAACSDDTYVVKD